MGRIESILVSTFMETKYKKDPSNDYPVGKLVKLL
jgi:hypothetical protein